jgi:hypothetical protein
MKQKSGHAESPSERLVKNILSLSQTSSGWQLIENQLILLWDVGCLQTYWADGHRSVPVAGCITKIYGFDL